MVHTSENNKWVALSVDLRQSVCGTESPKPKLTPHVARCSLLCRLADVCLSVATVKSPTPRERSSLSPSFAWCTICSSLGAARLLSKMRNCRRLSVVTVGGQVGRVHFPVPRLLSLLYCAYKSSENLITLFFFCATVAAPNEVLRDKPGPGICSWSWRWLGEAATWSVLKHMHESLMPGVAAPKEDVCIYL